MELYILSKKDLSILSICKVLDYQINLDEETNAKSIFTVMKTEGLKEGNYIVANGLYRQFLFVISTGGITSEKGSDIVTITALDISNIFDRKVIEKNKDTMKSKSIEQFIANTISENFVNSDDTVLNINYIEIHCNTNTKTIVATNAENGLYNFHTFLINCRQYKDIYTDFRFESGKLRININKKNQAVQLIDTTLSEVTEYNEIREDDITAKVQVYIRENGSTYNLYLKTDRTTTTNKDDPNRVSGKIEVISVDTEDKAAEEALNVMKGNNYNHLVEFKIAKSSQLMDITKLTIGRLVRIKTEDDIYDSYISAITLTDENFVYFKTGNLRNTILDKLKLEKNEIGDKLDSSGGIVTGNLNVQKQLLENNNRVLTSKIGDVIITSTNTNPSSKLGGTWTLIDKEFKHYSNSNEPVTLNSTNLSSATVVAWRNGHETNIRVTFVNKVELNDGGAQGYIDLLTFNQSTFGSINSDIYFSRYFAGMTDGGNGFLQLTISSGTRVLSVRDVLTKSGGNIPAGSTCYVYFSWNLPYINMIDSACDKFYWKRTA